MLCSVQLVQLAVHDIPGGQNVLKIRLHQIICLGEKSFLVGKVIRAQVCTGGSKHEIYGIQGP